jgi:hypothetical protein
LSPLCTTISGTRCILTSFRQNEAEYFSVGHGAPETILTQNMFGSSEKEISGLFCGVGDGRNLLLTLAFIGAVEKNKASGKKFHFTLLDLKPAVFARDLLLLQLLSDVASESKTKSKTLVALSYMFGAQVMPKWAFDRLQHAIDTVLLHLERENTDVMDMIFIPHPTRSQIRHHLQTWKQKPELWYTAAALRKQGLEHSSRRWTDEGAPPDELNNSMPPGCEDSGPDAQGYRLMGVMMPSTDLIEKHEPRLAKLCAAYSKSRSSAASESITQYLDAEWQPNVTLVDLDYENKREGQRRPLMDFRPHEVVRDLFGYLPLAMTERTQGVFNHFVAFFQFVAQAIAPIRARTTIEIVVGEMADTFERLHHGFLRQQHAMMGKLDPSTFPNKFDAIHMSNIPDYVGGPLTTFLHGLPVLRNDGSEMMSMVLRNTTVWTTHDQFLAEYLLLGHRSKIYSHFGTDMSDKSKATEKQLSGMMIDGGGCVMALQYNWKRGHGFPLAWNKLMSREEVKRWLYAHFLKLCLPFKRGVAGNDLVIAPLNMMTEFHLVSHLHRVGYPAHWLGEILALLCEGEITTTARAPTALITDVEHVQRVHPLKKLCLQPFTAEFRTLLAIWRPLLPFGLILPNRPLPAFNTVKEFRITFPRNPTLTDLERPHFVLVLKNTSFIVENDLRSSLLDVSTYSAETEDSIHVISTFQWEMDTSTVTFWFDEGVIDEILEECDWEAYIWRSDIWTPALGPVDLHEEDALVRGGSWV